ncbi:MAG TPA: hypothetical protein VGA08_03410 [Candidatus Saccharimonadales bacterium]
MLKDRTILSHTVLSLFLSQLAFWLIFASRDQLPPQVPLWYLRPWGELQLADQSLVWLLPGLVVGILAINLIITSFIHHRYRFLSHFLLTTTTVTSLFLLLATLNLLNRLLGWV